MPKKAFTPEQLVSFRQACVTGAQCSKNVGLYAVDCTGVTVGDVVREGHREESKRMATGNRYNERRKLRMSCFALVLRPLKLGNLPSTIKIAEPKINDFNIWAGPGVNGGVFAVRFGDAHLLFYGRVRCAYVNSKLRDGLVVRNDN